MSQPPDTRSRWLAGPIPRAERVLVAVCLLLIVAGIVLRVQRLGAPTEFMFDEKFFVGSARRYLEHRSDGNDHPPLGKLVIAVSLAIFGDNPVAWRLPSALAGIGNIALAGALGRALFRDRVAGLLAATFVAVDGFLICYSRSAVMDQQLVFLFLATMLVAARARGAAGFALAAVLAGLACAVKFTGVVLLVPLVVRALAGPGGWAPRLARLPLLGLTALAYGAACAGGLAMSGRGWGPSAVVAETARLYGIHAALNNWSNPWVSHWYTWFVPLRPITIDYQRVGEHGVRSATALGNVALWWGADLAILATIVGLVLRWLRPARFEGTPVGAHARAAAWLLVAWASPLVPWMVTDRDSYLYHYLPSWPFAVVLTAGWAAWLYRSRPRVAVTLLALVAVVFCLHAPHAGGFVVDKDLRDLLLFWPGWEKARH